MLSREEEGKNQRGVGNKEKNFIPFLKTDKKKRPSIREREASFTCCDCKERNKERKMTKILPLSTSLDQWGSLLAVELFKSFL